MQIFDSIDDLHEEFAGLELRQFLLGDYVVEEFPSARVLHHQVVILVGLDDFVKLRDVGVSHFPQDLHLSFKPHPIRFIFGDLTLLDYFDGHLLSGQQVLGDVHFTEGAFADFRTQLEIVYPLGVPMIGGWRHGLYPGLQGRVVLLSEVVKPVDVVPVTG